jgi:hypothetical protein
MPDVTIIHHLRGKTITKAVFAATDEGPMFIIELDDGQLFAVRTQGNHSPENSVYGFISQHKERGGTARGEHKEAYDRD